MEHDRKFTVCYKIKGIKYIISKSDKNVEMIPVIVKNNENEYEIALRVKNCSKREIVLKYVTLWEAKNIAELGVGDEEIDIFRSGRHKNDMPGVFSLGVSDKRLKDVCGTMSETGDRICSQDVSECVVSDHLTVFKGNERSLVAEFCGGREQLFETVINLDGNADLKSVASNVIFNVILEPGETVESEKFKLVYTDKPDLEIEKFAMAKAEKYGSRHGQRPAVFCTWYYYGLSVTYEDVCKNLEIMKAKNLPFDVFQIDEGWEITLGEWAPNEKFSVPMKDVATQIREAGYRPGIWTSPFIAHETANIWREHPEWILRDKHQNPCLFPMNDTVYYVFDITNPQTHVYFKNLYEKLTFEWGYTYHKLDFTRAAVIYPDAVFYDKKITLARAYYNAVSAIREGMGDDSYFLMCGGLYDAAIGLVDAQRTGSDVLSMWSSTINKDGKTLPYTIKQSILRYYMNYWWDNDPDALMIRRNETMERGLRLTYGLLNDDEVRTAVINQFMSGGLVCSTEPLDKISDDRLLELRRIIPVVQSKTKPVNIMSQNRFPNMVMVHVPASDTYYLCIVNWDDEKVYDCRFTIEEILPEFCGEEDRCVVCDYYSGLYFTDVCCDTEVYVGSLKPHSASVIKIKKQDENPVVVKSNGHFTMECEFSEMYIRDNSFYYKAENLFDRLTELEVMLPGKKIVKIVLEKGYNEGKIPIDLP